MIKKIKLYLDTSVISHLHQPDRPDWMELTLQLWDLFKTGKYEIILSNIMFEEIDACKKEKREILYDKLDEIVYTSVSANEEIEDIANEIIKQGILKEKNRKDCRHIGCAIYSQSKYLVSWNIVDLANIETNEGVRRISSMLDYPFIQIIKPDYIVPKEDL